jgi:alpha-L-rhamnosidase
VAPGDQQQAILKRLLAAKDHENTVVENKTVPPMSEMSYYFRFYLNRAIAHAGLGNLYLPQLAPWYNMLDLGLSTWAETPEPTRSDCHAWSASPNYDLLTIVAGIQRVRRDSRRSTSNHTWTDCINSMLRCRTRTA